MTRRDGFASGNARETSSAFPKDSSALWVTSPKRVDLPESKSTEIRFGGRGF